MGQWEETASKELQSFNIQADTSSADTTRIVDIMEASSDYYYLVSPPHQAGIGWSEGIQLLKRSGSVPPTQTVLHAEGLALLMAAKRLHALGYTRITFIGDFKMLYEILQYHNGGLLFEIHQQSIAILMQDILALSSVSSFCFHYALRRFLQ
ncbi:unnamed protein product [Thlaspi arvense]|uniref:RNase H type-1 domain-containing protein n=1 Tax=Thlaspi arvense TaxID=13288 RepID=A0AAU9RQ22_THLAR|nr:unnamed protein product [Thlaspi arvense]